MKLSQISHISESELLDTKLCDMEFDLSSSPLMRPINDLKFELNQRLINFMPHIWISDDWFSPDGVSGFALPFYLLHPRLIQLEQKFTQRIEGKKRSELMKLLRHETAHALDNSFKLRNLKKRQKLFGLTSKEYPISYIPNPYSKQYVRNLEEYYAQAHPDEDWAETFACWLDPKSNWKKKYQNWPALEKLNFLDQTMMQIKNQEPLKLNNKSIDCISKDKRTLKDYYSDKRKSLKRNKVILNPTDSPISQLIIKDPIFVKKVVNSITKNSFATKKILAEITTESKKIALGVDDSLSLNKEDIEPSLTALTKKYIKQNRHKVFM